MNFKMKRTKTQSIREGFFYALFFLYLCKFYFEITQKMNKEVWGYEDKVSRSDDLCTLYAFENITLASCCRKVKVSESTFRRWLAEEEEIREIYVTAKALRVGYQLEIMAEAALTQARKLLTTGIKHKLKTFKTETTTNPDGSIITKEITGYTEKTYIANSTDRLMVLKAEFPKIFADTEDKDKLIEQLAEIIYNDKNIKPRLQEENGDTNPTNSEEEKG